MPLPTGHQWENTPPTISNQIIFGAWIGASNLPVGAQTTTSPVHYNIKRNLLYKHNNTLTGFSDPPNNQSVASYPNLNEAGTQNIVSFFSEKIREHTDRKIINLTAGESTKGLTNQLNGFASPLVFGQTTDLLAAASATIGKKPDFVVLAVSDGDMKFNPTEGQIITLITNYITALRGILTANTPIYIRCPGLVPTNTAIANIFPTWERHNTILKALDIAGVYPINTDSLTVATYREADEIHGNALGNSAFADLLITAMLDNGFLPKYS